MTNNEDNEYSLIFVEVTIKKWHQFLLLFFVIESVPIIQRVSEIERERPVDNLVSVKWFGDNIDITCTIRSRKILFNVIVNHFKAAGKLLFNVICVDSKLCQWVTVIRSKGFL